MQALFCRQHGSLDDLRGRRRPPDAAAGRRPCRRSACAPRRSIITTCSRCAACPASRCRCRWSSASIWRARSPRSAPGVDGWKPGDRVLVNPVNKKKGLMGEMLDGGMAEYCRVAADQLVAMPDGVSFEDAAALPVAYGTAHRMLITHKTVKAGERVLVLGASGGVGTGCVHPGEACSAPKSSPAPSSAEKLERLKATRRRRGHRLHARPTGRNGRSKNTASRSGAVYDGGVDVVINFTGGDTWVPSLRCLKRGGKLLVCGATAGYDPKEDLRYVWSFEMQDHRLQQLLRRRSRGADAADRRRQDEAGDRQGAAARTGARRVAADRRAARSSARWW